MNQLQGVDESASTYIDINKNLRVEDLATASICWFASSAFSAGLLHLYANVLLISEIPFTRRSTEYNEHLLSN